MQTGMVLGVRASETGPGRKNILGETLRPFWDLVGAKRLGGGPRERYLKAI